MLIETIEKAFTKDDLQDIFDMLTLYKAGHMLPEHSDTWAKRIACKLIPLSKDLSTPKTMLSEWLWDRENIFKDLHDKCELCGHNPITYSFKLSNAKKYTIINGVREYTNIYCGSSCVMYFLGLCNKIIETKYDLDSSFKLMTKKTNELKEKERRLKIIEMLHNCDISDKAKRFLIEIFSNNNKKVAKLTPKQANIAVKAINMIDSEVAKSIIVTMSTKKRKIEAIECLENIRIALSPLQLKVIELTKK